MAALAVLLVGAGGGAGVLIQKSTASGAQELPPFSESAAAVAAPSPARPIEPSPELPKEEASSLVTPQVPQVPVSAAAASVPVAPAAGRAPARATPRPAAVKQPAAVKPIEKERVSERPAAPPPKNLPVRREIDVGYRACLWGRPFRLTGGSPGSYYGNVPSSTSFRDWRGWARPPRWRMSLRAQCYRNPLPAEPTTHRLILVGLGGEVLFGLK